MNQSRIINLSVVAQRLNHTPFSVRKFLSHQKFLSLMESRSESQFVGLNNQGATCYLNSLIQAMYLTPELRFGLFSVDPKELGAYSLEEYLKEKSEAVTLGIVEPDETLLEQLKEFGIDDEIGKKALIAIKNSGVMEAMDYIDQHEKELKAQIATAPSEDVKKKKKKPRLIPLELQRLFTQMQLSNKKSLSTQGECVGYFFDCRTCGFLF